MSPVRRSILVPLLMAACAPAPSAVRRPPSAEATPAAAAPANGTAADGAVKPEAAASRCTYSVRRVSAPGRGALHPQIAAVGDAFAVAWEETSDHRSIRVQSFALDAQPLGPSIEVTDVGHSAAGPKLAATPDGDGWAVFWSADARIDMRRIDRAGKPKSDVVPVVVSPGARALDVTPTDGGYALAWWNWSGTPHQLAVTFADKEGRALGKPQPITRVPSADPTVDVMPGATLGRRAPALLTWDETVGDADHVIVADVGRDRLDARLDLGPGETPRFGADLVVFERPEETAIWVAPLAGAGATALAPTRLTDGHIPAAARRAPLISAICFLRDTDPTDEGHVDELICGTLLTGGLLLVDQTRITLSPRAIFGVQMATAGSKVGVVWQEQDSDDTAVSFAALTCPEHATASPPR